MEPLHAPWRIEYILAPKPENAESLFARIAQSSDDEANHVIARDRTCYALLNTYPYTGGHLMVVPYKQTPDLHGLTDEELADLLKLTRRCSSMARFDRMTAVESARPTSRSHLGLRLAGSLQQSRKSSSSTVTGLRSSSTSTCRA